MLTLVALVALWS